MKRRTKWLLGALIAAMLTALIADPSLGVQTALLVLITGMAWSAIRFLRLRRKPVRDEFGPFTQAMDFHFREATHRSDLGPSTRFGGNRKTR